MQSATQTALIIGITGSIGLTATLDNRPCSIGHESRMAA